MDYSNYIKPIFVHLTGDENICRRSFVGNGFFIDDFFITASHIIVENQGKNGQSNPFITIGDKDIELIKENACRWKEMPYNEKGEPIGHDNENNADYAVFHFPGIRSPLRLSEYMPEYGEEMQCDFFHYLSSNKCPQVCSDDLSPACYYWQTNGKVFDSSGFLGNFFGVSMSPHHPIGGGSSGSPLIKGNIVYGILHAGNPYDNENDTNRADICIFNVVMHLSHNL